MCFDWLRRLLSYLSLNARRYRLIAQHYVEHAPAAAAREHMVQFYDYGLETDDPTKAADYLASVFFNLLVQLANGPSHTVFRGTPDDTGCEQNQNAT